jgi:dUTP pyrophosphatase
LSPFLLKVKLLGGIAPIWSLDTGSAGLDIPAAEDASIASKGRTIIPCGFATEFPEPFVALLYDRSGLAANRGLHVIAGVIDASYRGEWKVCLYNTDIEPYTIRKGERIAQCIFLNRLRPGIEVVSELSDSVRGARGFSSGMRPPSPVPSV